MWSGGFFESEGFHHLFEVEAETCGGNLRTAIGRDQVVVTTAAADRRAKAGFVGFEHDARVIVERAHDREIDQYDFAKPAFDEQIVECFEFIDPFAATERCKERANFAERFLLTAQHRQLCECANGGLVAFGGFREVIERYEVRGMERTIDCVFPASIHLAARDKIAQHARRTEGDAVFADACFRECFGEERDDVRISFYARFTKTFNAHLREFAGCCFCGLLAEDTLGVAQLDGGIE